MAEQKQALSREESIAELCKTIDWMMKLSDIIKTIADMFAEEKSLEEIRKYAKERFGKVAASDELMRLLSAVATLFGSDKLAQSFLNDGDDANWHMNGFLLSQLIMGADMSSLSQLDTTSIEDSVAAGQRTLDMLSGTPMDWQLHGDGEEMLGSETGARIEGIGIDISAPICKCEEPCHHFDIRTSLNSMSGPAIEVGCCKCGTFISRPLSEAEFFLIGGCLDESKIGVDDGKSRRHLRIVRPGADTGASVDAGGESANGPEDDAG